MNEHINKCLVIGRRSMMGWSTLCKAASGRTNLTAFNLKDQFTQSWSTWPLDEASGLQQNTLSLTSCLLFTHWISVGKTSSRAISLETLNRCKSQHAHCGVLYCLSPSHKQKYKKTYISSWAWHHCQTYKLHVKQIAASPKEKQSIKGQDEEDEKESTVFEEWVLSSCIHNQVH